MVAYATTLGPEPGSVSPPCAKGFMVAKVNICASSPTGTEVGLESPEGSQYSHVAHHRAVAHEQCLDLNEVA